MPNFVRVEIFRSAATIMKRSSTSMGILESETLVKCIEDYVGSEDANYVTRICCIEPPNFILASYWIANNWSSGCRIFHNLALIKCFCSVGFPSYCKAPLWGLNFRLENGIDTVRLHVLWINAPLLITYGFNHKIWLPYVI